jgi:hypothetical protein
MNKKIEKERRKIDGFDLKQNIMVFPEPENSLWILWIFNGFGQEELLCKSGERDVRSE